MSQLEGENQQALAPNDAKFAEAKAKAAQGMLAEVHGGTQAIAAADAARKDANLPLSAVMFFGAIPGADKPPEPVQMPEAPKGFANNLAKSFTYSLIQGPVDGLSQLADKSFGTSWQKSLHFMDAPVAAKYGSADWAAQQIGGAGGMIAPYLLLHTGVSKVVGREVQTANSLSRANIGRFAAQESGIAAISGTIYGGVLTPVNSASQNFWGDRFRNAATTGLTFATLTGSSIGLQGLGRSMSAQGRTAFGNMLQHEVVAGIASAVPAGIVHADGGSLLAGKGLATGRERTEAITTFAMIGGVFGGGHRFLNNYRASRGQNTEANATASDSAGATTRAANVFMLGERIVKPGEAAKMPELKGANEQPVTGAAIEANLPPLEVGKTTTRYQGLEPNAVVERVIDTKNGGKIVMFSSGEKVIDIPGEAIRTQKAGGRIVIEARDGKVSETRIKSQIPLEEKPLNVASGAFEQIGKDLSNFADRPFTLDGRQYASVEAFYQGLKWPDAAKRAEVSVLTGKEAKFSAREAPKSQTFEYEGQTYKLGSPEHHQLMKRAIRESLEQNPEVMKDFLETYPRPIEHKTGRRENPRSAFPGSTFTRILTELRAELREKHGVTNEVPAPIKAATEVNMGESKSVSETLRDVIDSGDLPERQNLEVYSKAMEDSPHRVQEYVTTGSDSVVMKLTDGNILKLTKEGELPPARSFDMPVVDKGTALADQITVNWFVQPEAKAPVAQADLMPFLQRIRQEGYRMIDPSLSNLGYYKGEVKLLDPWAVVEIPRQ